METRGDVAVGIGLSQGGGAREYASDEGFHSLEGNMCGTVMRGADALPRSKATSRAKGSHRNLGVSRYLAAVVACRVCTAVRIGACIARYALTAMRYQRPMIHLRRRPSARPPQTRPSGR